MTDSPKVLITGASSGIGAATADYLAAHGMTVYGTSRSERSADPDERGVHWLALDVCNDASVAACVDAMLQQAGAIDGLVCNAGFGIFGSVEETSLESARAQFETNYFGVLRLLRHVLPGMRERGSGRIVLVGSLAGRAPIPFQSHYSSTKAAVDALALSLRSEVAPAGIQVALVEPGDIATPFNDAMDWGEHAGSAYGERIRACEAAIRESLPKAPKPVVVAQAIHRALSDLDPKPRYPVGADSTMLPLGKRFLPERLVLALIRRRYRV